MIADLAIFVRQCLSSGALLGTLCAMLVIPPFAWLGVRALTPTIFNMNGDRRWQAALAAFAAALPGVIFAVTALVGIAGGIASGCLRYTAGRAVFMIVVSWVLIALVRATWLAYRRNGESSKLLRASDEPSAFRLIHAAAAIPAPVRELPVDVPFCAVGGIRTPMLLVSRGTVARLSEPQLRAALWHEYAHVLRRDPLTALAVTFFSDLLPFGTDDLVALYRQAREFVADAYATGRVDRHDLAEAVIKMARAGRPAPAFAALATEGSLRGRMDALFNEGSGATPTWRRAVAVVGLIGIATLGAVPSITAILHYGACLGMRA